MYENIRIVKHANSCKLKQELRTGNLEVYEIWYASHDCNLNFQGSVSKVKATGAKTFPSVPLQNMISDTYIL